MAELVPSAFWKSVNVADDLVVSYCTTVWKDNGDSQCLPILKRYILAVDFIWCILLTYFAMCSFANVTTDCAVPCHSTKYWQHEHSSSNLNRRFPICLIQFQPPQPLSQIELSNCSHLVLDTWMSSSIVSQFCILKLIPTEYNVPPLY